METQELSVVCYALPLYNKETFRNYPSFHILFFLSDVGDADIDQSKRRKDKLIDLGIGYCRSMGISHFTPGLPGERKYSY